MQPGCPIFLIGPRGSGKTTIAQLLAARLGWNWVDADAVIEEHAGRSIREIFADEGERGFRERERAVIGELCQRHRHVIATGGGAVLDPNTRRRLTQSGWVVWLTADVDTLWGRITGDPVTAERRPALREGGREEVARIVAERAAIYEECAHTKCDTGTRTAEEIADEIVRWLARG